jgi:hypothetical protein
MSTHRGDPVVAPPAVLSRRAFLAGLAGAPALARAIAASSRPPQGAPGPALETRTRTVRVRPLEELLRVGLRRGVPTDPSAAGLFGMSRLDGFILDAQNRDVLLFGQVDRRFPALRLDWLVSAMRNVWQSQADPACSIDPLQDDLATVMSLLSQEGIGTQRALNRVLAVCRHPQEVSIFGVPRESSFARTMVEADYHMKKVAAGIVPHPAGQRSFKDLGFAWMAAAAKRDCGTSAPAPVMARFWFYPGTAAFERAEGIFAIREVGVRLLTEEEHIQASGRRVQTGHSHPAAEEFRHAFTESYRQAAMGEAIYAELRSLYRMVALAMSLRQERVLELTGMDLDLWLHAYPEERVMTAQSVPGVAVVQRGELSCTGAHGTMVGAILMPMCGGVVVPKAMLEPSRATVGRSDLSVVVTKILHAEPSPGKSLFWDVRLQGVGFGEI